MPRHPNRADGAVPRYVGRLAGRALLVLLALSVAAVRPAGAQPPAVADDAEQADAAEQPADLSQDQQQLAARYKRFEDVLLRLAELTAGEDPDRAALLRRAVAQSKNRLILLQFERLVERLDREQLAEAISGQSDVTGDMKKLLDLLLSEDRAERLASEKARLQAYLKELNELIKNQRAIQRQTEQSGDTERLAAEQGKLAERTGKLGSQMQQDAAAGESADEEGDSSEPSDEAPPQEQAEPSEGEPAESSSGEPSESTPGESSPGQSPPGSQPSEAEEPQPSEPTPGQERLEAAEQRMREAEQKLEEAKREESRDKQEQALAELEQAKAQLEEILRQLREEEMQRMLAMLEARFRKMLDEQIQVYEGTVRLGELPPETRNRSTAIEAGRLGRQEAQIVFEADKMLELLREEGSAVAFPEAVSQMRDDMQQVSERLAAVQVDTITQRIEEDIIAALEEMIEALKKAQQDMDDSPPQPGNPGTPQEPPLIDALSELKMIRALQMRVNRRTQLYAEQLGESGQAEAPELLAALEELAEREARIFRTTRDIVVGRNQ